MAYPETHSKDRLTSEPDGIMVPLLGQTCGPFIIITTPPIISATRDTLGLRRILELHWFDLRFFMEGGGRGEENVYLLVDRAKLELKGSFSVDISITASQHGADTSILQFTINPVPHFALRGNKGATLRWDVGGCRVVPFKTRPTVAFREDIKIIFARFSMARLHNGGLVTIRRCCTLCHLADLGGNNISY